MHTLVLIATDQSWVQSDAVALTGSHTGFRVMDVEGGGKAIAEGPGDPAIRKIYC